VTGTSFRNVPIDYVERFTAFEALRTTAVVTAVAVEKKKKKEEGTPPLLAAEDQNGRRERDKFIR